MPTLLLERIVNMLAKMKNREKYGLLGIFISILFVGVTLIAYNPWYFTKTGVMVVLTGYILIIGFALSYRWWFILLIPLWIFASTPDSIDPPIKIINESNQKCHVTILFPETNRSYHLVVSPNSNKVISTLCKRFGNHRNKQKMYVIYQFPDGMSKLKEYDIIPATTPDIKLNTIYGRK